MTPEKRLSPSSSNSNIVTDILTFQFAQRGQLLLDKDSEKKELSTMDNFESHLVECGTCLVKQQLPAMFIHALRVHGVFLCLYCLKFYILSMQLVTHLQRHHGIRNEHYASLSQFLEQGENDTKLLCVYCNKMFSSPGLETLAHNCCKRSVVCHKCDTAMPSSLFDAHNSVCNLEIGENAPPDIPNYQNVSKGSIHFGCRNSAQVLQDITATYTQGHVSSNKMTTRNRNVRRDSLPPIPKLFKPSPITQQQCKERRAMPKLTLRPDHFHKSPNNEISSMSSKRTEIESNSNRGQLNSPLFDLQETVAADDCQKIEEPTGVSENEESQASDLTLFNSENVIPQVTKNINEESRKKEAGGRKSSLKPGIKQTTRMKATPLSEETRITNILQASSVDRPRRCVKRVVREDFMYLSVVKKARPAPGCSKLSGTPAATSFPTEDKSCRDQKRIGKRHEEKKGNKRKVASVVSEVDVINCTSPGDNQTKDTCGSQRGMKFSVLVPRIKLDPLLVEQDAFKRLGMLVVQLSTKLDAQNLTPYDRTNELILCQNVKDESSEQILSEMVRVTCGECCYCRQVKLIRADKRQLAIHLLTMHRWKIVTRVQKSHAIPQPEKIVGSCAATTNENDNTELPKPFQSPAPEEMTKTEDEVRCAKDCVKEKASDASNFKETTQSEVILKSEGNEDVEKSTDANESEMNWTDFKLLLLDKVFRSDTKVFAYSESDGKQEFGQLPCECLLCGYNCDTQKNLFGHWSKCHCGVAMTCAMCQGKFLFAGSLFSHVCLGTASPVTAMSKLSCSNGGKADLVNNTISLRYECSLCENCQLPGFFNYMVHLRKEHHMCELCLETCASEKELERHVKKHKLNSFCWKCGIAYCEKQNFMNHLFFKHGTAAEQQLCSKCLNKKWIHSYHFCLPRNSFACDNCRHTFSNPKALLVHKRLHSGQNLKTCSQQNCNQKFISTKLVQKHMENDHLDLPEPGESHSVLVTTETKSLTLAENDCKASEVDCDTLETAVTNPPESTENRSDSTTAAVEVAQCEEKYTETKGDVTQPTILENAVFEKDETLTSKSTCENAEGLMTTDCDYSTTTAVKSKANDKQFNIEQVTGPNLSEESEDDEDVSEGDNRNAIQSPADFLTIPNNLNTKLGKSAMEIDENLISEVVENVRVDVVTKVVDDTEKVFEDVWTPSLPPLDLDGLSTLEEDYSLPEHIRKESAMFTLMNEHDYCISPMSNKSSVSLAPPRCSVSVSSGRRSMSPVKKLKICRPSTRKSSPKEYSSSSSSSSCGSNCSCSSSSSTSDSSSSSDSEDESRNTTASVTDKKVGSPKEIGAQTVTARSKKRETKGIRSGPSTPQQRGRPKKMNESTPALENDIPESDLETEDSGSEEIFHQKQLTEIIGNGISPHDEIWDMSNENYLLRLVHGVKEYRHLLPKT